MTPTVTSFETASRDGTGHNEDSADFRELASDEHGGNGRAPPASKKDFRRPPNLGRGQVSYTLRPRASPMAWSATGFYPMLAAHPPTASVSLFMKRLRTIHSVSCSPLEADTELRHRLSTTLRGDQ